MGAFTNGGQSAIGNGRVRLDVSPHGNQESGMSNVEGPAVERIIANTINETARGDPDALAARIVAGLAEAGFRIVPANGIEETALGPQPFDKLTREMRPQDRFGDGRDWTFRPGEHGGDEPDNMPQTIRATDAAGRWAIYVPLTRGGKIVVPRPYPETVSSNSAETRTQLLELSMNVTSSRPSR